MFDPEFLELMPLVAELRPPVSRNNYGEQAFDSGSAVFPHCHVQMTGRQVYQGLIELYEEGVIYLDGVYTVDSNWALFIPQPAGPNRQVTIISVDQNTDEAGWHHTAVHFGAL